MPLDSSTYIKLKKCCNYRSIQGPKGDTGATGPQGPQGPPGDTNGSTLQYTVTMERNNFPNEFVIAGVDPSSNIATGQTGNYTTDFGVLNNHVYLTINSITATDPAQSCQITITGTSLSESTAVPISGDTEVITFTASNNTSYQSIKKWLEVTSIALTTNISSINYDIALLGYVDFLNEDVIIKGYRAEILGDYDGTTADITLNIRRIKQNGSATNTITLEDITVDGDIDQVVDNLRTGSNNRSYTMTGGKLWPADSNFVLKQTDFNTYFTGEENYVYGSNNEGIIIKMSGDLGPNNGPRFISLSVYFNYQ